MSLIQRKRILLAKVETTYGIDATPTGALNAIETENLQITPLAGPLVARNIDRPYLGGNLQIQTGQFVEVTFDTGLAGGGTATTAPKWGPLAQACGFSETIGGSNVVYAPVSTGIKSLSIYFHHDGQKHVLLGARGDITQIQLTPGEIGRISWRFVGLYSTPSSVADPSPVYTGWQVPRGINNATMTTFSLAGSARIMVGCTLALGNDVQYRNVVGGETVEVVDREPAGQLELEAPALSSKNWFTDALNSTTGAFSAVLGTVAGNIVTIGGPVVQIMSPTYDGKQGISTVKMGLSFVPSAGNDEITITTT